jgi:hypothetical protein
MRHTIRPRRGGKTSSAQVFQASNGRTQMRMLECRGTSFASADVGWCHEIRPRVDIGRLPARRNARAAARKTNPGIAAPACVPRPVPNGHVQLPRHACVLPRPTPPASCVWRTCRPGFPYLAAQPKRHNRRLSYPPPSHKARLGNMYWAALIAWCAPVCLRGPDWASPPQPARFC